MKDWIQMMLLDSMILIATACASIRSDQAGPVISDITTSDKVVVISDCLSTAVTITAKVTDASNIKSVLLWYRVGSDQPFASTKMSLQNNLYAATVKGSDLQGGGYGAMEIYITAEDEKGNKSESPPDTSVQFLPCVNN